MLVPVAMRVAIHHDIVDRPGGYKLQANPVPYLGGVAILLSFVAVVLGAALVHPPVSGFQELAVILGGAAVLGLLGLADDLRGLSPWLRLAVVIAVSIALITTGVTVRLLDSGGPVDSTITVLWVLGITNAFNLLDNMDGLSSGVATIAALSLALIAAVNGQFLVGALSAALAGCAVGFLRHNRYPARVYMGDAGSLFLGFVLAVLALKLRFNAPVQVTAFVPLVVMGLPILDTALVTVERLRHGRNPLDGGRDHISHRLVCIGLPPRRAVYALYVVGAVLGLAGLLMSRLDVTSAYLLLGIVATSMLGLAGLLVRVHVYDEPRTAQSAEEFEAPQSAALHDVIDA